MAQNGRATSVVVQGITGHLIEVEAQVCSGLPQFNVVGLADTAVREAKERVRSALLACGLKWPQNRITVNISPAYLHKRGTGLDLAISVAICMAAGLIKEVPSELALIGELRLDGRLQPVRGVLAMAIEAYKQGKTKLWLPSANEDEGAQKTDLQVTGFSHLSQVLIKLGAKIPSLVATEVKLPKHKSVQSAPAVDLADIKGNEIGKIALEIAAVGGHHLLMVGAPGCGKTMLAAALAGILPEISEEEAYETTLIHSVAGQYDARKGLLTTPPFQAPHHTCSKVSLVGGGSDASHPGAVSLAHNGVLFLDEMPEFTSSTLQVLRQPLENGEITISRAKNTVTFPARFQLIAAANPCPCGNWNVPKRSCKCTASQRVKYLGKLGGPLVDRIDLRIDLQPPSSADVAQVKAGENSAEVKKRVLAARERSQNRLRNFCLSKNAQIPHKLLWSGPLAIPTTNLSLLYQAYESGSLSLRGFDRVLRLAWTLADIKNESVPSVQSIQEALTLRNPQGIP